MRVSKIIWRLFLQRAVNQLDGHFENVSSGNSEEAPLDVANFLSFKMMLLRTPSIHAGRP